MFIIYILIVCESIILVVMYFSQKDTICVYWKSNDSENTLNTFIKYTRDLECNSENSTNNDIARFRIIKFGFNAIWSDWILDGVNAGCQVNTSIKQYIDSNSSTNN